MKRFNDMRKNRLKNRHFIYFGGMVLLGIGLLQNLMRLYEYRQAEAAYQEVKAAVMISDIEQDGENRDERYKDEVSPGALNEVPENPIDFSELKAINGDIAAWLAIDQLGLSYPIVQGDDNSYYLEHLYDGTRNMRGSIMLNCDNQHTFDDQNTIIYGHNTSDGSMFGALKQYRDIEESIEDFWIYTPQKALRCHILLIAYVEITHPIYRIKYTESAFWECMQELKTTAYYWEEPDVYPRSIITLSTCNGEGRLIVVAYLT